MKSFLYISFLLVWAMANLSSCKEELIEDPGQYSAIYMPQATEYPAVRSLKMADTLQSFVFGASFGGVDDQSKDIQVTFKADPGLVDDFNTENSTDYPVLPTDAYTLSSTSGEIKPGIYNTAGLKLSVKTVGSIEPLRDYLLPVSISDVNGSVPVNEKLRTTYFLVKGVYEDFNRDEWTIYQFSSEDNVQTAPLVLDGDITTMWHTAWREGTVPPPHFIAIDMQREMKVHGVYMWPDNRTTGAPKDIHMDVSVDGTSWNNAGDYSLPNTNERHTVYFSETLPARYFKITVKNTYGDLAVTRLTEIGAF